MNLKCFFITILISNTFCYVSLGKNDEKTIYTNEDTSGYFYIRLNEFKSLDTFYVSIGTDDGGLSQDIQIIYTQKTEPNGTYPQSKFSYGSSNSGSSTTYYYKLDYQNYQYLFIKYKVIQNMYAKLTFKTYDSDPLTFIFIIVGCVFGAIIIGVIIFIIWFCKRRKKSANYVGGIAAINAYQQAPIIPGNPQYPQAPIISGNPQYPQAPVQPNLYQPPS